MGANILVFGDSIVQGMFDRKGGWVDRLKQFGIKETLDSNFNKYFEVYNLGRSGDTTIDLLKRIGTEIKARVWEDSTTVIIMAVGINDSEKINKSGENLVAVKTFKDNLVKMLTITRKYSDKIVFISLTPVDSDKVEPVPWSLEKSYSESEVVKYNNIVHKFCKQNSLDFVDVYSPFAKSDLKKLLIDGVHPNTKGHELIFKTVKNYLEKKKYI